VEVKLRLRQLGDQSIEMHGGTLVGPPVKVSVPERWVSQHSLPVVKPL